MNIVTPAEWGARVNYDAQRWRPWRPDKYVIHWPGSKVTASAVAGDPDAEMLHLRGYERYHIDAKGWLGIAYNYAFGNSGNCYRLRGEQRSGATSGDAEPDGIPENHEARAVLFIVGPGDVPSPAALEAFRRFRATDPKPVTGHKFVDLGPGHGTPTTCPGPWLSKWIEDEGYDQEDDMALAVGDEGRAVRAFEAEWNQMADRIGHFRKITVDGKYTPALAGLVRDFQEWAGLPATGQVDGLTAWYLHRLDKPHR